MLSEPRDMLYLCITNQVTILSKCMERKLLFIIIYNIVLSLAQ